MTLRRAALAAAFVAACGPAHAHTVIEGVSGFPGGVLHPLLVPAHGLLLLTLGLLAGQRTVPPSRLPVLLFPLALLVAIGLIATAVAFESQNVILGLCAINGVLLALARPLPPALPAILAATGAIALMLDSVPALLSVTDTLVALGGTALSAALLFGLAAILSACLSRPWQMLGRRIAGSWAAASAVLVLALRLVK